MDYRRDCREWVQGNLHRLQTAQIAALEHDSGRTIARVNKDSTGTSIGSTQSR